MPLIAQITCAVAVTALVVGPWWASAPDAIPQSTPIAPNLVVPLANPVPQVPAVEKPKAAGTDARPAHLNLDVRHNFGNVDFSVTVDGKPALSTRLEGSGKRFGFVGKRSERGYTKTLDLTPGVHIVKVRVRSLPDKFDQTRVERFDLASSAVASMRIAADKSGLSLVAERPPAPVPVPAPTPVAVAPAVEVAPPSPQAAPVAVAQTAAVPAAPVRQQEASTIVSLLQSVRSMLIGIAGFVASTATAFMVQEFLRTRKGLIFAEQSAGSASPARGERRRRRRVARQRTSAEDEDSVPAADQESSVIR